MIPDEAVEAAARAITPAAWGPSVWQFAAHGETPTDARDRVQKQALQDARRALEAATPYLTAEAWDEGAEAATDHWVSTAYSPNSNGPADPPRNPYRELQ